MKATSIFGGVQFFLIFIGIIRSKFVAVLLGPSGMGIAGLFAATTGVIASLTSFGLGTSAVKDISAAHSNDDTKRISTVVSVFRRLIWLTGMLGTIITLVFSPWLSEITFGNKDYTWAFIFLSVTMVLNQISAGQSVLLRGMRKIRFMAQAGMIGSVVGLVTTIPLYYFFGEKGIVPGIIITSVTGLLLTWYFARKLKVKGIHVTTVETISEGAGMLKLGFLISLSSMITLIASYIVRIFISNTGGVEEVGLYNAGFNIINSYVGMVFAAMSTDYYPRLAAVADNNNESKTVINQQAEIALLILAPIIIIFIICINWVVIILYSTKFIPINEMIHYAILGVFFKAASWAIAFIFLAKGAKKLFFWNELITNMYMLIFNLLGYHFWGLKGLGISFLLTYVLYLIQVFIIAHIKFQFNFTRHFYYIFVFQFCLAILSFLVMKNIESPYSYLIGAFFIATSIYYALKELDKRMDIKSIFMTIKNKF